MCLKDHNLQTWAYGHNENERCKNTTKLSNQNILYTGYHVVIGCFSSISSNIVENLYYRKLLTWLAR